MYSLYGISYSKDNKKYSNRVFWQKEIKKDRIILSFLLLLLYLARSATFARRLPYNGFARGLSDTQSYIHILLNLLKGYCMTNLIALVTNYSRGITQELSAEE